MSDALFSNYFEDLLGYNINQSGSNSSIAVMSI